MIINRIIFVCLLIIGNSYLSQAQLKEGYKALKKGEYETAIKAFEVDIFNPKGNIAVEAEHNLAKIFFDNKYENFNLERAYEYAKSALERHDKLSPKEIDKVQNKGLGRLMLENHKRQIVNLAYDKTRNIDSYQAYELFLKTFDGPTPIQFQKATQWRNQRALDEARRANTWNAYEHIYKKYHESCVQYTPHVDSQLQVLMFEAFMEERGWNAFYQFANQYPKNIYVRDSAAAVNFLPIANSKSINVYKNFIMGFPKSPFVKIAVGKIMQRTMEKELLDDYDYFVRTYPDYPGIEKLWERYHKLFLEQKGNNADREFQQMYPNAPDFELNEPKGN